MTDAPSTPIWENHTPTPWKYVPWHVEEGCSTVRAPAGHIVCCTASDSDAALICEAVNNHARLTEENRRMREALASVSAQCGNVIFNCEQRPADNDRHLSSWRGVKEFADAYLTLIAQPGNSK